MTRKHLRGILGDLVFALDDDNMESTVLAMLRERGWTLGVAESLTGSFLGARLTSISGLAMSSEVVWCPTPAIANTMCWGS